MTVGRQCMRAGRPFCDVIACQQPTAQRNPLDPPRRWSVLLTAAEE